MRTIKTISGGWDAGANAWVSETLELKGTHYLEVTLPEKGRLVIKKSETEDGAYPKALITEWTGPDFTVRIFGSDYFRYFRVYLTCEPTTIQIVDLNK